MSVTWNEPWDGNSNGALIYIHPEPLTQFFNDYDKPHGKDFRNLIYSCFNAAYLATSSFINLTDTPELFESNMMLVSNATGDALEWTATPASGLWEEGTGAKSAKLISQNCITSEDYSIAVGNTNEASGTHSTVIGGFGNQTSGYGSGIISGDANKNEGSTSFIGGGLDNKILGAYNENSGIIGGFGNTVNGLRNIIIGSRNSVVSGEYNGIYNSDNVSISNSTKSVIIGGSTNTIDSPNGSTAIIASDNSSIDADRNAVIIGCTDANLSDSDTVMVPRLETNLPGEGIIMRSPNGTKFKLTVDNAGNLVSTLV